MKFLFVMDPIEKIKVSKDTSYCLMEGASQLGHDVFYCLPEEISYERGRISGEVTKLNILGSQNEPYFEKGEKEELELSTFDTIFIRKDPPFDQNYLYLTQLLDLLPKSVRVLNAPQALRDYNEKLFTLEFSQFMAPTVVTSRFDLVKSFLEEHGRIVVKPIDGFAGKGIRFFEGSDLKELEKHFSGLQQFMVQKFVEEADQGDKRILLVNGEPIGAILRKAESPGKLNNLDQGGKAFASDLNERDLEVCKALKNRLIERDLFFVGIDMLGPFLTEINITSPTGLREMSQFMNRDLNKEIIEILAKLH